jgi:cytochrome c-type biogenesis protein CcmH
MSTPMAKPGTAEPRRVTGRPRRRAIAIAAALALALCGAVMPAAGAATARASFTQIQNDVMCVACHEPLAVAQSPEAFSERQYIRQLIAQGETRKEIEQNLVEQYGASVLALPPAHGFNLLVYVVPPLVLLLGAATLAVTIPKWRRRSRLAAAEPAPTVPAIDPADARRLDEDLGHFA